MPPASVCQLPCLLLVSDAPLDAELRHTPLDTELRHTPLDAELRHAPLDAELRHTSEHGVHPQTLSPRPYQVLSPYWQNTRWCRA